MKIQKHIYEKSSPGRKGVTLPAGEKSVEDVLSTIPTEYLREFDAPLPEVSEGEAMRHFVSLSILNHHIDKGFYPLGSCTMKYNPKLNDKAASHPAFTNQHPQAPENTTIGNKQLIWDLKSERIL